MYKKYPVAIWRDNESIFSVSTVSGTCAVARGPDKKKCMEDLKKYIAWRKRESWFACPDFENPNADVVDVRVRTEVHAGGRDYPSAEPIHLKVPYVWGELPNGSISCCFPLLDQTFYCYSTAEMKTIVREQAERFLRGMSPEDLLTCLPPSAMEVDTINVRLPKDKQPETTFHYPALEKVGTSLASRDVRRTFSRNWQRGLVTNNLAERLASGTGNIMLVGKRGVGKTTVLVNAIRQRLKSKRLTDKSRSADAARDLKQTHRFWMTSADRLVAGMQYLGQWEAQAELVIEELATIQGVLCVESLGPLLRLGGNDAVDSCAAFFQAFLHNRELRMIVEATPQELDACRRLLPNFESLFQVVTIDPMNADSARRVLLAIAEQSLKQRALGAEPETAELCCQLFHRFLPYERFPGSCVDFWSNLFERGYLERKKTVSRDNVIDCFIQKTGLPEALIRDDFCLAAEEIKNWFCGRVIDQPAACHSLTNVVTTFKAGLNDPGRPVGVQLFCGPTGVGKTELAKALADYMFGSGDGKDRLVRLDMSEYGGLLAGERLVMQPDGQPSDFIKKIRAQPLLVVLLDEIEKASPAVFDVLMGVFDEGRLTDRWGRTTDFRSTVIVMTSNLGVRRTAPVGFDGRDRDEFESEVRRFFRPEFFNRIDKVISFSPLKKNSIAKIAELELAKIQQREGLEKRGLKFQWTPAVVDFLAIEGYDVRYGARPLQRTIEKLIVTPMARTIAQSPGLGNTTLACDLVAGTIEFQVGEGTG